MTVNIFSLSRFLFCIVVCAICNEQLFAEDQSDPLLAGTGELLQLFRNYPNDENHLSFLRWEHYAGFYELNFRHFDWYDRPIRMLEIGVLNGGSAYIWKDYFRNTGLTYVGIDINPLCKQLENKSKGIHIEIGSQDDANFLRNVCARYGPFDIVIDDGSHITSYIVDSFEALWPSCMADNAVYVVEDLHTMNFYDNQIVNGENAFGYFTKLIDQKSKYIEKAGMTKDGYVVPAPVPEHPIARHLFALHFYDSMVFLHFRKRIRLPKPLMRGKKMPVQKFEEGYEKTFGPRIFYQNYEQDYSNP